VTVHDSPASPPSAVLASTGGSASPLSLTVESRPPSEAPEELPELVPAELPELLDELPELLPEEPLEDPLLEELPEPLPEEPLEDPLLEELPEPLPEEPLEDPLLEELVVLPSEWLPDSEAESAPPSSVLEVAGDSLPPQPTSEDEIKTDPEPVRTAISQRRERKTLIRILHTT
jgi:protein TonB